MRAWATLRAAATGRKPAARPRAPTRRGYLRSEGSLVATCITLRFEFFFFPGAAACGRIAALDLPAPRLPVQESKSKNPVVDDVFVVPGHGQRHRDRKIVVVEPIPAALAVERRDRRARAAGRPLILG